MKLRRIHTNSQWWFCVFKADHADDHVLLATVPGVGCFDIAMKLTGDEVSLFKNAPEDFVTLARDFVASRDMPIFCSRLISFQHSGSDFLEIEGAVS
jgi:hypothetical protein